MNAQNICKKTDLGFNFYLIFILILFVWFGAK